MLFAAPFAAQSWAGAQAVPPASGTQLFLPLLNGGDAAAAAAPLEHAYPGAAPAEDWTLRRPPPKTSVMYRNTRHDPGADASRGHADGALGRSGPLFLPLVAGGQPGIDAAEAAFRPPPPTRFSPTALKQATSSAWSTRNNAAAMSVTSGAALVGSRGMQVTISSTASAYVSDERPVAEPHYRARFYFDPNSITMAAGDSHYIFSGYAGSSTAVLRLLLQYTGGSYQLRASFVDNGSTWTTSPAFTIADTPHYLELEWKAATAPGAKTAALPCGSTASSRRPTAPAITTRAASTRCGWAPSAGWTPAPTGHTLSTPSSHGATPTSALPVAARPRP